MHNITSESIPKLSRDNNPVIFEVNLLDFSSPTQDIIQITNWNSFQNHLSSSITGNPKINSIQEIETTIEEFNSHISTFISTSSKVKELPRFPYTIPPFLLQKYKRKEQNKRKLARNHGTLNRTQKEIQNEMLKIKNANWGTKKITPHHHQQNTRLHAKSYIPPYSMEIPTGDQADNLQKRAGDIPIPTKPENGSANYIALPKPSSHTEHPSSHVTHHLMRSRSQPKRVSLPPPFQTPVSWCCLRHFSFLRSAENQCSIARSAPFSTPLPIQFLPPNPDARRDRFFSRLCAAHHDIIPSRCLFPPLSHSQFLLRALAQLVF
ncbi:hypothetical protein NPIL_396961 [Nephila pilipes]|uniref:Uncharacterized protein n=1 Tax=Nephila pilipes TaxID=299642 RepID=A0A8X6PTP6_NEPPI|nr:hypothetical protein NPIL_396961 [Nephila pilipes]